MQRVVLYFFATLLFFHFSFSSDSQTFHKTFGTRKEINSSTDSVVFTIRNIVVSGNKKTRTSVILRELPFKEGDKLPLHELVSEFEIARTQIMNTSLFHDVIVALKSFEGYDVDISITVKERWYLFPLPYFKMVDRNLNQWLVQHKASLNRVNYGIKLLYNNVTGYRDKLNVWLMSGYTHQVSMSYDRPYIDRQMKWGVKFGMAIGKNREVNYATINNKEVFLKDTNNFIRSFFRGGIEFNYRPAIKTTHHLGIAFTQERVNDTIVKLNPEYFSLSRHVVRFPEIYYQINYSHLDYIPFPLKGFEATISLNKKGLNSIVNVWELKFITGNYFQLSPKLFFALETAGVLKLPFQQPFYHSKLMGYGQVYMQGYEYYVVDGVAGGCIKTTLLREFLNFKIHLQSTKHQTTDHIPFRVFGKIFTNAGYVYNPQPGINHLDNKMLYSAGVGLDILTFYDINFRLEWSFNQLGQNGIYLHRKSYF